MSHVQRVRFVVEREGDGLLPGDVVLWTPGTRYADVVRRVPMDGGMLAGLSAAGVLAGDGFTDPPADEHSLRGVIPLRPHLRRARPPRT